MVDGTLRVLNSRITWQKTAKIYIVTRKRNVTGKLEFSAYFSIFYGSLKKNLRIFGLKIELKKPVLS